MSTGGMEVAALGEAKGAGRVLAFTIDDGLFSVQLDWVAAVYRRDAVEVQVARSRKGKAQPFLVHRGEPALIIDPREMFGLAEVLGETRRHSYVLVRSGSYLLALPVDECIGVKELDLRDQVPVPSSLVRDGGVSVGHLVEQEGSILVVLDPNRLLDGAAREALEPALREARALIERQRKIDPVWKEICEAPTLTAVRTFARLCRRARSKAASAAKTLLKHWESAASEAAPTDPLSERIVHDLVRLSVDRRSGEIIVERSDGGEEGRIFVAGGRIIDVHHQRDWGRRALRRLLELREGRHRLAEGPVNRPDRMAESTAALVIAALESISEERRSRRER